MSFLSQHVLQCDGCGRSLQHRNGATMLSRDKAQLRRWATSAGWRRKPKRSGSHPQGSYRGADVCPECANGNRGLMGGGT